MKFTNEREQLLLSKLHRQYDSPAGLTIFYDEECIPREIVALNQLGQAMEPTLCLDTIDDEDIITGAGAIVQTVLDDFYVANKEKFNDRDMRGEGSLTIFYPAGGWDCAVNVCHEQRFETTTTISGRLP